VLDFLREEGLVLIGLGAEDILDKNSKLILGLIWQIIYFYHIKPQKEKEEKVRIEKLLRRKKKRRKKRSTSNKTRKTNA